jgi:hypothetical protein
MLLRIDRDVVRPEDKAQTITKSTKRGILTTDGHRLTQRQGAKVGSLRHLCRLGGLFFKLDGLLQEADESQLWLELLRGDGDIVGGPMDYLLRETDELSAIFTGITSNFAKQVSDFSFWF